MTDDVADDACDPVPETGMATGNDDGEPGEVSRAPLDAGERELLDRLEHAGGEAVITEAEEDTPEVARAVEEDSVVPEG